MIRPATMLLTAILLPAGCAPAAPAEPQAAPPSTASAPPSAVPAPPSPAPAPPVATAPALSPADAALAGVLKAIVTPDGFVRYDRIQGEVLDALDQAVRGYAAAPRPADEAGRIALWSNAYNANVLLMAHKESRKPAFENVAKIPGFFDQRTITVAGERLTLNALENDRIRGIGDARIHAALVCAAVSCPPLRAEPFVGARLEAQLDDQARRWVDDATKNRVGASGLEVSRIFEWYGEDFVKPPYRSVADFIARHATPGTTIAERAARGPSVTFLEYDWTLNQAP